MSGEKKGPEPGEGPEIDDKNEPSINPQTWDARVLGDYFLNECVEVAFGD